MIKLPIVICLTMIALSVTAPFFLHTAAAQSGGVYEMWGNVGAGGTVSGGAYQIAATTGQPDAGQASGGAYTLGGGFWGGGVLVPIAESYRVFLPLVIR
jgi:uncharacterized membrane protein